MCQMAVLLPGGTDSQTAIQVFPVFGQMEIGRGRILQIIALPLMHPAELVQCREAVTGGTGGKQAHGIFVPGMLLALNFGDFATA